MAIAHRVTPDSEPKLTKQTAFHPRWSALTRQLTEYRGYWLPTSFDGHGAIDEYWACREGAVVMDLSPLRKFEVVGPDAEALLQAAVTRNIRKLATGQVVYTAVCNETGGMLDDATVFRLGQDTFRFVGGDAATGDYLERPSKVGSYQANPLGIHDMHGNAWEWCDDLYEGGRHRVLRGGGWLYSGAHCQAAYRFGFAPSVRNYVLGFRLARVPVRPK